MFSLSVSSEEREKEIKSMDSLIQSRVAALVTETREALHASESENIKSRNESKDAG